MKFLYRGVTRKFYEKNSGRLNPKTWECFDYTFHWDEPGVTWDSGATWDKSEENAVMRHQLNQEGFPTSGISTTPYLERAKVYARGREGHSSGYVYKIDGSRLATHGVTEFVVAAYVKEPSIPEDDEVILVAEDFGALPDALVVEIIPVPATGGLLSES